MRAFPDIEQSVREKFNDPASKKILEIAEKLRTPKSRTFRVREDGAEQELTVTRLGAGPLETPYGEFWMVKFGINDAWQKYTALIKSSDFDLDRIEPVFSKKDSLMVRIDSGCETGQVFHDKTCDCREQLHHTMEAVAKEGEGIIVNIPSQDGRGQGIGFKLSTLFLQKSLGINTVEAAAVMAKQDSVDVRTYGGVIGVLKYLGINPGESKINLATNNPDKIAIFTDNGYATDDRPVHIPPTEYTAHHLAAKGAHLGHNLGPNKR